MLLLLLLLLLLMLLLLLLLLHHIVGVHGHGVHADHAGMCLGLIPVIIHM
jgi:hypothetical protein